MGADWPRETREGGGGDRLDWRHWIGAIEFNQEETTERAEREEEEEEEEEEEATTPLSM